MPVTNDSSSVPSTCNLLRSPVQVPRLLVSVRNATEAIVAIAGGCDILDVKEPHHGSLGRASVEDLRHVVRVAKQNSSRMLLSAALGEIDEHVFDVTDELPAELHFVKLGCARLGDDAAWQRKWADVRRSVANRLPQSTGWVAVAYADWELARSPHPQEIIQAAADAGCRGVLFDTYAKTSGRLLDWLSVADLQTAADQIHSSGMFFAMAGSVRLEDLPQLSQVHTDIIGIRGAACAGNQRTGEIRQFAIQEFHESMRDCWQRALRTRQGVGNA